MYLNFQELSSVIASNSKKLPTVIAIGTPDFGLTGKGTILNALAGEALFEIDTPDIMKKEHQLETHSNEKGQFYNISIVKNDSNYNDTIRAFRDILLGGGHFVVLFFVKVSAGQILGQDADVMKLILDEVPRIRNKYGVILNQVSKKFAEALDDEKNYDAFISNLFSGVEKEKVCSPTSIYNILKQENAVYPCLMLDLEKINDLKGLNLESFVFKKVSVIHFID